MDKLPESLREPLAQLLLSVADDKFMLGHRNADWTGLAPILEEDIAFSALAQDEIAHASTLYEMVGGLVDKRADALAFGRRPEEYRCARLVTLSDGFDWALALGRNFFCDHFDFLRLHRLARSSYTPLAQLAARLAAEEQIHVEHVDAWIGRLGRGGPEARERMQRALHELSALAPTLLEPTEDVEELERAKVYPGSAGELFAEWSGELGRVAQGAGLEVRLQALAADHVGGRHGRHGPEFAALLDELTEVFRVEPEAAW